MASGHTLHTHGQRQCDRGQKALWHKGHNHAHGKDKALGQPDASQGDGEHEKEHADTDSDHRHSLGRASHLFLQGAQLYFHPLRQVRDLAELGFHAGGEDDGLASARCHAGPGKDQVGRLDTG